MRQGRVWELGMALRFYLSSNILLGINNLSLAWSLVSRGLMPITPPAKVKGSREVAVIMDKVQEMQKAGGKQ